MMPASVGVNWPVRMPPMMMIGIISGTAAALVAVLNWPKVARWRLTPTGPKKWL